MRYRSRRARLSGLLVVAALGAMALAASAQAVTPGFLINKLAVGALTATVEGTQEGTSTLLVPGLNFKISCTAFTTEEGKINSNSDAKFILLYTGCTALSITKSPEEIACEVVPIKAEFLVLPAEMIEDPGTKETLPFAVLSEAIKALINLTKVGDLTKECILPFDTVVKGEICLKIKVGTNDTAKLLVLTNEKIQTECKPRSALEGVPGTEIIGKTHAEIEVLEKEITPKAFLDELRYGTQTVTVDGAAELKLTGAHSGNTLGVSLY